MSIPYSLRQRVDGETITRWVCLCGEELCQIGNEIFWPGKCPGCEKILAWPRGRTAEELAGKGILFMVRRRFFDEIVAGDKLIEWRAGERWRKLAYHRYGRPLIATFMCGPRVHRRVVRKIDHYPRDFLYGYNRRPVARAVFNSAPTTHIIEKLNELTVSLADIYPSEFWFYAHRLGEAVR